MNRSILAVAASLVAVQTASFSKEPHPSLTPKHLEVLSHMSLVQVDDGFGNLIPTILIKGANVQIVNGAGHTYDTNGRGNLIVGYQEAFGPVNRTGSHNVIIGSDHDYSSYSGLSSGGGNQLLGMGCTILSGQENVAQGSMDVILAGDENTVNGFWSVAIAGHDNTIAVGPGNRGNAIIGATDSSINGGADANVIVGGYANSFDGGQWGVIAGGHTVDVVESYFFGTLGSQGAHVLGIESGAMVGGSGNTMGTGQVLFNATMVGGQSNLLDLADHATVVGGKSNSATGDWSTVTGGLNRSVSGAHDWRAGALFQDN